MNSRIVVSDAIEEIRSLLGEHRLVHRNIQVESNKLRPDTEKISEMKKQKLMLKDAMETIMRSLPPSPFGPRNAALFVLSDSELDNKRYRCQMSVRDKSRAVGPTAASLVSLRAELRDVEYEIDRRELEAFFPDEDLVKAA